MAEGFRRRDLLRYAGAALAGAGLAAWAAPHAGAQAPAAKPSPKPKPTPTPKPTATPKPTRTPKPTASTSSSPGQTTSSSGPTTSSTSSSSSGPPPAGYLELHVNDGMLPMVDGALVYHRGFGLDARATTDVRHCLAVPPHVFTRGGDVVASRTYPLSGAETPSYGRPPPHSPDPARVGEFRVHRRRWASVLPERVLVAEVGATIALRVHNHLAEPHELALTGVGPQGETVSTGPIDPGAHADVVVAAPPPGTYVLSDPGGHGVERVLGLFAVLLVVDPTDPWVPYPGGPEFERQWVWVCHDIDPAWARAVSLGETVDPYRTPAVPRYFTLNGRSGYQSLAMTRDANLNRLRHEDTLPSGAPRHVDMRDFSRSYAGGTVGAGQLIRMVNPGIVKHQMHFHGNHVWTVRRNGRDFPRTGGYVDADGHVVLQAWEDVVELNAMERKDVVLPLRRPPDAVDEVWVARSADWTYPMHCHAEPSQTAAGGLYPGGLVAHWALSAPGAGGAP